MEDELRAEYNLNSLKVKKLGPARRRFGSLCVRLADAVEEIPNSKAITADVPISDSTAIKIEPLSQHQGERLMTQKTHHVIPDPDGGWSVKKGGASRASKHFETKTDAVSWGREVSKHQDSEFVIHKKDGTIQRKDSHGNDPLPPKDRT